MHLFIFVFKDPRLEHLRGESTTPSLSYIHQPDRIFQTRNKIKRSETKMVIMGACFSSRYHPLKIS